ncbi:hypothetical protein D3C80_1376860 [compost metagenome]
MKSGHYFRICLRISVAGSHIIAQLYNADIRVSFGRILSKRCFVEFIFQSVKLFKSFTEMHEDEIGFLSNYGIYCSAASFVLLHKAPFLKKGMQFFKSACTLLIICSLPGSPID